MRRCRALGIFFLTIQTEDITMRLFGDEVVIAKHQHEGQPEVLWLLMPNGDHVITNGVEARSFTPDGPMTPFTEDSADVDASQMFGEYVLHSALRAGLIS